MDLANVKKRIAKIRIQLVGAGWRASGLWYQELMGLLTTVESV